MSASRPTLLAAAFTLLFAAPSAEAQVVVYDLKFDPTGDSINYRSYQSGFYVAPMSGGTGSLILMLTTSGVKQYFTYSNFGELFVAVSGNTRKVVFSATAANTVSTTTFYAIGSANERISVETRAANSQFFVARRLQGYSVSADSERDLPFSSAGSTDVGVAGAAFLTASFSEERSTVANRENRAVADEITNIQEFLTSKGFTDGLSTTGGAGGGAGGGAAAAAAGATGAAVGATAAPAGIQTTGGNSR